jgi:hypothetical protein
MITQFLFGFDFENSKRNEKSILDTDCEFGFPLEENITGRQEGKWDFT